jgi:hypothetical protein
MRLEAAGGNWNDFYCGDRKGCPYHKKKCDPDYCGHYHHYKNGDYWKIEDGKIVFPRERVEGMSHRTDRARRSVTSKLYADMMNKKANSGAALMLRREIFRLARCRDILGTALIFSASAIIILSILLYLHW